MKKIVLLVGAIAVLSGLLFVTSPTYRTSRVPETSVLLEDVLPCEKILGFPRASYDLTDSCEPARAHELRVQALAEEERRAGDTQMFVHIRRVYEEAGDVFVVVDPVDWLSPEEGTCIRLGEPASDSDIPFCNPNGFLFDNEVVEEQIFLLSPQVKIRLLEEFGSIPDLRTYSPREFLEGRNRFGQPFYRFEYDGEAESLFVPFDLILKNGSILFIHQRYVI